jgi:hypothetical protein
MEDWPMQWLPRRVFAWACMLLTLVSAQSCVMGPVRYKTFGYRIYATVELPKQAHPAFIPVTAPVGLVGDVAVTVLDTLFLIRDGSRVRVFDALRGLAEN